VAVSIWNAAYKFFALQCNTLYIHACTHERKMSISCVCVCVCVCVSVLECADGLMKCVVFKDKKRHSHRLSPKPATLFIHIAYWTGPNGFGTLLTDIKVFTG
jgi:hypothetical protein